MNKRKKNDNRSGMCEYWISSRGIVDHFQQIQTLNINVKLMLTVNGDSNSKKMFREPTLLLKILIWDSFLIMDHGDNSNIIF